MALLSLCNEEILNFLPVNLFASGGQQLIRDYGGAIAGITAGCEQLDSRCNKDLGERTTLRKMSRGHQFVVRAGGHIDSWTPLYQ